MSAFDSLSHSLSYRNRVRRTVLGATLAALSSSCFATSYYVSPSGSDSDSGNHGHPFRTLSRAAILMGPGDVCYVRAGVYRESVRPARSGTSSDPIVFQAYNGEPVTLDGADPLSGWTSIGGGLWTAAAPATLGQGNDQIFVAGAMVPEAHWPNSGNELMRGRYAKLASGSYEHLDESTLVSLSDPKLTLPASSYVGALARWWAGDNQSVAQTGTVTAAASGSLTVKSHARAFYEIVAGNEYVLYGKKEFIDQPGEWAYDAASGTVTMMFAPGVDPNKLQVEMKRRQWAFDLSDRSYISLSGFRVFGNTVRTNKTTKNVSLSSLWVTYPSHYLALSSSWGQGWDTSGIWLQGTNNVIRDSIVEYSAGNGVSLVGSGSQILNCLIHDVNYAQGDMAGVYCTGSNFLVKNNTIYNAPRSLIAHNRTTSSKFLNNELYYAALHTTDAGATYAKDVDGQGTELAYNLVHDVEGHLCIGMFLDNYTDNFKIHHNVLYGVEQGLKINRPAFNNIVSNNTVQASSLGFASANAGLLTGTRVVNNLFDAPLQTDYLDALLSHNLDSHFELGFVNKKGKKPDLRLKPDSPAVNAGLFGFPGEIGIVGDVDLGAYELGSTPPVYGARIAWAPPAAPTGLDISVDDEVANLSWTPRDGATSYNVYRATRPEGPFELVANVAALAYTDGALTNGATYYYQITAANDNGESGTGDVVSCVPTPTSFGTGLWATYFQDKGDGKYFTKEVLQRNETGINFNTSNSVAPGLKTDNASARWEGQVQAPVTGSYSFSTLSDDGVRVWVDGKLIIDNWTVHAPATNSGTIDLVAGQKYDIKVEYFEKAGWATLKLMWSYPGVGTQVIPTSRLYAPMGDGILGTYYNDPSTKKFWTTLVGQRLEPGIQFDWAGGGPGGGVQVDNFTALYTGRFWAPETGTYTFTLQGDNGCRLYIDGKLVIDQWYWNTGTWKASVALAGLKRHDIRLEYAERTGYAILKLGWLTPSANVTVPMPASVFFSK